jgi:hypothetical protein
VKIRKEVLFKMEFNDQHSNGSTGRSGRHSPSKNHYEQVDQMMQLEKGDSSIIHSKLSPLIKDYKARPIYETMP